MRPIPKSRIIENQYTNGNGVGNNIILRFADTKKPYIGFYTIVNGNKYYSGKTYDKDSKLLEQYKASVNPNAVASAGSIPLNTFSSNVNNGPRYFYKDLTSPSNLIKEIDRNAYNQLAGKLSNTYQVISYNSNTQTLEEVNKQMPGLAAFLGT
jgi:hypothetical protein